MTGITTESWFWWAVALVVGVPVLIVALGELNVRLVRRDNSLAKPIALFRNFVVPVAALLVLLWLVYDRFDETPFRVVATIFGFLLLLFVLSSLNAALFLNAERGWRRRMPTIFVDLVRLVLIVVGVAILLALVWDANVGGMFAALGVTGIVVGLALQNAVGGIISGLLLLFEQPFTIGDWLDTGSVKGRVTEVNWRAVHIDTGNEIHVVPNASLAGTAFANMSRPTRDYTVTVETTFAVNDRLDRVHAVLDGVAADLPQIRPGATPTTAALGGGGYATSLPVETYADAGAVRTTFMGRLWYASRRAGLHLDGGEPGTQFDATQVEDAVRQVASALYVSEDEVPELSQKLTLETYSHGEVLQSAGQIPDSLSFVIAGRVAVNVETPQGWVPIAQSEAGDYIGQTVLTREPSQVVVRALGTVTVLRFPRAVVDELVKAEPRLGRDIGEVIDRRRTLDRDVRAEQGGAAPEWQTTTW